MTIILSFLTIIIVKKTMISYIILEVNFHMKSRLKELRARHGWNQSELARRANISRQTISLIEREEFMPSLLIAVKISRVFDTPLEDIFYFDEEELT